MNSPCMQLQNIQRTFDTSEGPRRVLADINLEVSPGDRIVLFGPSGCGKTTLLHLMAFLDQPTRGKLIFQGAPAENWNEAQRCGIRAAKIGLVFQQFHLLPHHSVMENVLLRLRYLKDKIPLPVSPEDLLTEVGLRDRANHPARLLSGGEKQRLCIARAMLLQPALFLADEPTGNLDAENGERVRQLFSGVSKRGAAMVIATHDKRWFEFATRVFHFAEGRLIEDRP